MSSRAMTNRSCWIQPIFLQGCYKKKDPPQDSRCPAIVTAVTKQHSRLDKILVYWGSGENTTRCYLPKVHGDHGWCKTNGVRSKM